MGSFILDPELVPDEAVPLPGGADGLTTAVLLHNARWFTRIRWIVVCILAGFGAAGLLADPAWLAAVGLLPPGMWPLTLATVLTLLNLGSILWVRRLSARTSRTWSGVAANTWFQIVSDLIVLTVVVCHIGPTQTVIAFSYLFHITLACIFFGRRDSFLVTVLSVICFLTAVILEYGGHLPAPSLVAFDERRVSGMLPIAIFAVPSVFVWGIVWYLVSSLSEAVRRRDRELDAANQRLMKVDEEINLNMLRVTHDLKAPFSGIESNIQVLKSVHWDETPESVRAIIGKIDARSAALRARIGDILTLGSLRFAEAGERVVKAVDLRGLLDAVLNELQGLAAGRHVSIRCSPRTAVVSSDPEQLKILFSNLVSNAVVYSRDGGTVEVETEEEETRVTVRVVDHGIGISEKALPRIFDDFFRSQEAAAVNQNSTGLGLAIVRQVARNLRLSIAVESEPGKGTVFQVFIPRR